MTYIVTVPHEHTENPIESGHSQGPKKMVFKTDYRLMQVKSKLQGEYSAILSTFIKLSFVIKILVWSIFQWPLKTGFVQSGQHLSFHYLEAQ